MDNKNRQMLDVWTLGDASLDDINGWLNSLKKDLIWKKYVLWKEKLGLKGSIKTIETGCGYAMFSMFLGFNGEQVTLFDYNDSVLESAGKAHNIIGLNPELLQGDLLNVPEAMHLKYDMVCSFGTLEHFFKENRKLVFENTVRLLSPGGLLFFTVPSSFGLFYRLIYFLRKLFGLYPDNFYEKPFTKSELIKLAESSNITPLEIVCTGTIIQDFNYWIMGNVKSVFRKIFGIKKEKPKSSEVFDKSDLVVPADYKDERSYFDRNFTYKLLFVGQKIRENK